MLGHVLFVDEAFYQLVAMQQALNLMMQVFLQAFLGFLFGDVHGVLLPVERGQRLRRPRG
jgi:hydrogenase/urease accessory protein HupE